MPNRRERTQSLAVGLAHRRRGHLLEKQEFRRYHEARQTSAEVTPQVALAETSRSTRDYEGNEVRILVLGGLRDHGSIGYRLQVTQDLTDMGNVNPVAADLYGRILPSHVDQAIVRHEK